MRITPAGLRSSHPTTRFGRSPSTRRERQLGLRVTTATRHDHASRQPRARATAGVAAPGRAELVERRVGDTRQLAARQRPPHASRHSISFTWSRPAGSGSRRPRPRSAAPWRG